MGNLTDIYYADEKKRNFVGYMPLTFLADKSYISKTSCGTYMDKLEELRMVYVYKRGQGVNKSGVKVNLTNFYGRYGDKEYIDMYAEAHKDEHALLYNHNNVKAVDKRRSLTQKYNAMLSGKHYDEDTERDIYKHIEAYNKMLEKQILLCDDGDERDVLKGQLKDMSVFEVNRIYDKEAV